MYYRYRLHDHHLHGHTICEDYSSYASVVVDFDRHYRAVVWYIGISNMACSSTTLQIHQSQGDYIARDVSQSSPSIRMPWFPAHLPEL